MKSPIKGHKSLGKELGKDENSWKTKIVFSQFC